MTTIGDLPATMTPDETASALRHGAAMTWWQTTALLEVVGADAASLLDGLCTQAVERVEPGTGRLGLFLDAKAKVVAPAVVWRTADVDGAPRLLLELPADLVEVLGAHLRKYRLRAKVAIEPVDLAVVRLAGPSAATASFDLEGVEVLRTPDGAHGEELVLVGPPDRIADLLRGDDLPAGARLADADTWEAMRIDAARAGLHDLLPGRMPAEVGGMERAVALDAGCYLGQEPVARLHYRGHANRTLRRLRADAPISPRGADGLELRRAGEPDARPAGVLTTWAPLPSGDVVALAVVRRELDAGTILELPDGGGSLRVAAPSPEG